MRSIHCIILFFIVAGCTNSANKDDLVHLEGYWEIAEVTFPNGQKKEYSKVNPAVDFINLNGMEGYRKKVYPKLDGSFDTSDDAEAFEVIEKEEKLYLKYHNDLSEWEEYISSLDTDKMILVNEEGLTYSYRRYKPFNLTE